MFSNISKKQKRMFSEQNQNPPLPKRGFPLAPAPEPPDRIIEPILQYSNERHVMNNHRYNYFQLFY